MHDPHLYNGTGTGGGAASLWRLAGGVEPADAGRSASGQSVADRQDLYAAGDEYHQEVRSGVCSVNTKYFELINDVICASYS